MTASKLTNDALDHQPTFLPICIDTSFRYIRVDRGWLVTCYVVVLNAVLPWETFYFKYIIHKVGGVRFT